MKRLETKEGSPREELLMAISLLSFYAMTIFLSPDPEWVVWAGQMAVGVLYFPDLPPFRAVETGGALLTVAGLGALGLLAASALTLLSVKIHPGWPLRLKGHLKDWWNHAGPGV